MHQVVIKLKKKNSFSVNFCPKAIVKDPLNKSFESIWSPYAVVTSWKKSENFFTVVFIALLSLYPTENLCYKLEKFSVSIFHKT